MYIHTTLHKIYATCAILSNNTIFIFSRVAGVSRAGARTGLQLQGHGDMQGFDSSSPANLVGAQLAHASMTLSCIDFHTVKTMWLHVDTQKETRGSRIS